MLNLLYIYIVLMERLIIYIYTGIFTFLFNILRYLYLDKCYCMTYLINLIRDYKIIITIQAVLLTRVYLY